MSTLVWIAHALDRMRAEHREPARLLIGNREAEELDAELRPRMIPRPPDDEPMFPLDMPPATLFGVRVQRVDQPTLIGVIAGEGAQWLER